MQLQKNKQQLSYLVLILDFKQKKMNIYTFIRVQFQCEKNILGFLLKNSRHRPVSAKTQHETDPNIINKFSSTHYLSQFSRKATRTSNKRILIYIIQLQKNREQLYMQYQFQLLNGKMKVYSIFIKIQINSFYIKKIFQIFF